MRFEIARISCHIKQLAEKFDFAEAFAEIQVNMLSVRIDLAIDTEILFGLEDRAGAGGGIEEGNVLACQMNKALWCITEPRII